MLPSSASSLSRSLVSSLSSSKICRDLHCWSRRIMLSSVLSIIRSGHLDNTNNKNSVGCFSLLQCSWIFLLLLNSIFFFQNVGLQGNNYISSRSFLASLHTSSFEGSTLFCFHRDSVSLFHPGFCKFALQPSDCKVTVSPLFIRLF